MERVTEESPGLAAPVGFGHALDSPPTDAPVASSPLADGVPEGLGTRFVFLPGVVNAPPVRSPPVLAEVPDEPHKKTSGRWKSRPPLVLKYVDDGVSVDHLNFSTARPAGQRTRLKHAIPTQNLFRHVVAKAQGKGMVVNAAKTQLLVVSDSLNHEDQA